MCQNDEFWVIFVCLSLPFLAIYYAFAFLFEEKFSQICIRNDKKMGLIAGYCNAFSTKTHCNMHQNALQYAPKRSAFCTKTQAKMHQNAKQSAAKREVKCYKMQPKPIKSTILSVIYRHFERFERKTAW